MLKVLKTFILGGFLSGRSLDQLEPQVVERHLRQFLVNFILLVGGLFFFYKGITAVLEGDRLFSVYYLVLTAICILIYLVSFLKKIPLSFLSYATTILFTVLFGINVYYSKAPEIALLMTLPLPLIHEFLLGIKAGTIISLIFGAYLIFIRYKFFFISSFDKNTDFWIVSAYFGVLLLGASHEITNKIRDRVIGSRTDLLRAERDQVTIMKDNLKAGIFLMDKDYKIQSGYSKNVEVIMGMKDLVGINFTDLLKESLKEKERETIMDFFSMVINKSFDTEMLENINPLSQFKYTKLGTAQEKELRCTFSSILSVDNEPLILGTVEDITQEVELQNQLSVEDSKRQIEMNAMFEVIHIDPNVLIDFIEDTEFEFAHINAMLKGNRETLSPEVSSVVLNEIYQAIHAIKSNALILGLKSFSVQLHDYEDEIKKYMDVESDFDDMLRLTFQLEKLMNVNDGFKKIFNTIMSFTKNSVKMEQKAVFIQILEDTAKKVASGTGKLIKFKADYIDESIIKTGPRRMIKEMLIQLIRNAAYHGIEKPEERVAKGKDETGHISLIMQKNLTSIHIELADDGCGIDYDRAAAKAEELHLLTEERKNDKNFLLNLLFQPKFSTSQTVNMYAGRGAGLSLVKKLITDLKGTLKIRSGLNLGVCFIIDIPLRDTYTETL